MAHTTYLDKSSPLHCTQDSDPMCTHSRLTRLFDPFRIQICSECNHRLPPNSFGWIYRCTEDWDGFLPASDFGGIDVRPNRDAELYSLSRSIIQAASKGHYTFEELEILWNQKKDVRNTIQQARPNTASSTVSTISSDAFTLPHSTTMSTVRSFDTEPENLLDYNACRSPLQTIEEVQSEVETDIDLPPPLIRPNTYPVPCNYTVCAHCRQKHYERAAQSFNSIVDSTYRPRPNHEIENVRISNAHIVSGLRDGYDETDPRHPRYIGNIGQVGSAGSVGSASQVGITLQVESAEQVENTDHVEDTEIVESPERGKEEGLTGIKRNVHRVFKGKSRAEETGEGVELVNNQAFTPTMDDDDDVVSIVTSLDEEEKSRRAKASMYIRKGLDKVAKFWNPPMGTSERSIQDFLHGPGLQKKAKQSKPALPRFSFESSESARFEAGEKL